MSSQSLLVVSCFWIRSRTRDVSVSILVLADFTSEAKFLQWTHVHTSGVSFSGNPIHSWWNWRPQRQHRTGIPSDDWLEWHAPSHTAPCALSRASVFDLSVFTWPLWPTKDTGVFRDVFPLLPFTVSLYCARLTSTRGALSRACSAASAEASPCRALLSMGDARTRACSADSAETSPCCELLSTSDTLLRAWSAGSAMSTSDALIGVWSAESAETSPCWNSLAFSLSVTFFSVFLRQGL